MTAAWRKSTAASRAKRVATVDATPSESSRNEFAMYNDCPREALFKYLVRSKSFVITSGRHVSGNRFQQWGGTGLYGGMAVVLSLILDPDSTRRGTTLGLKPGLSGRRDDSQGRI